MARKPQLKTFLREARQMRGWTLQRVADQVGVTNACISNWETGKSIPRAHNLTAVCKVLKLSVRHARELANRS